MECVSDHPYQFHEMNDKVFIPFEINESTDTPFTEHIMPWTHDAIILLKTHSWQISLEKISIRTNYRYFISMWRAYLNITMS